MHGTVFLTLLSGGANLLSDRVQTLFRIVVVAAILSAFFQVTLGGVVRVTDSGLGCPDWPLCHGEIIPPFDTATLIEYSHRLSGSVLGLLVIATTAIVWMRFRANRLVWYMSIAALVLVIVAGILGGITVLTELAWQYRLLHLSIAEMLIGCLVVAAVAGWNPYPSLPSDTNSKQADSLKPLIIASLLGAFVLILSGSYMVGEGYGTSCATWPLCRGSLLPDGWAYTVHMGHRYIAAVVGIVILWTAWRSWASAPAHSPVRTASVLLALAFALQIAVGAFVIWSNFAADLKATHLSLATLVWVFLVFLSALIYSYHPATEPARAVMRQKAT